MLHFLYQLKPYFTIDCHYVISKIKRILFPFSYKNWNRDKNNNLTPMYDINAPDLYIPLNALITYCLLSNLRLDISAEALGSSIFLQLFILTIEVCLTLLILYLKNILNQPTISLTISLYASFGYKYVALVVALILGGGYWVYVFYTFFITFLLRTLKHNILSFCSTEQVIGVAFLDVLFYIITS